MRKLSSQRAGECVYCGVVGPVTRDHIPPKNLFPSPRPHNLIAVPSCLKCNQSSSKDDEYFRLVLALRDDTADHPAVREILPSVRRALSNPKKYRFTRAFLRTFSEADIQTPAGIYIGKRPAYKVDLNRLERVARRTAIGLFFHRRGLRLPDDYEMVAYSEYGKRYASEEERNRIESRVIGPLWSAPQHEIGSGIFSHRALFVEEDPNLSAWALTFFKEVRFVCISVTKEVAAGRPRLHY